MSSSNDLATALVRRLEESKRRIVFAESCTGGLIAAELAKVPGVSEWLCGSAVTYRCDTKAKWLGVREQDIEQYTAVSEPVAGQMAHGVLLKTPEASVSASITGHLGPGAPPEQDGLVYIGIAIRTSGKDVSDVIVSREVLTETERQPRQIEAAMLVMRQVMGQIS